MQLFGIQKWCSANIHTHQNIFWHSTETCLLESLLNEKGFWLRFVKWVRFFERNCIVKLVILFASYCWLWDFLLENLKLKKSLMMSTGTVWINIKTLYAQNNIFKKRIPNMRFWIIYILIQISFLRELVKGVLARVFFLFFLIFMSLGNHGGWHFYSVSPTQKSFLWLCTSS